MQRERNPLLNSSNVHQGGRRTDHSVFRTSCLLVIAWLAGMLMSAHYSIQVNHQVRRLHGRKANGHQMDCSSKSFKENTLKLVHDQAYANLFGQSELKVYEASDVTGHPNGDGIYTVFDNSYMISRTTHTIGNFSHNMTLKEDALLRWNGQSAIASGFEFIAYNKSSRSYIVGREAVEMEDGSIRSQTIDVQFSDKQVIVGETCDCDFKFTHNNKGFEGALVITTTTSRSLLLALCEGNYCSSGKKGRQSGNGRIIVMERTYKQNKCTMQTINVVALPRAVDFQDYSAMALWNDSTIAITSQENAAVYIGKLSATADSVQISDGRIYDFPRSDSCEVQFCNVEGAHFLEEKLLLLVSDSMKGKKQRFGCRRRDESLHVMVIP